MKCELITVCLYPIWAYILIVLFDLNVIGAALSRDLA